MLYQLVFTGCSDIESFVLGEFNTLQEAIKEQERLAQTRYIKTCIVNIEEKDRDANRTGGLL